MRCGAGFPASAGIVPYYVHDADGEARFPRERGDSPIGFFLSGEPFAKLAGTLEFPADCDDFTRMMLEIGAA